MKLIKLSFFALTICLSLVNVRVSARQPEVSKNQFLLGLGNQSQLFAQSSENLQAEADKHFQELGELGRGPDGTIKDRHFNYLSLKKFEEALVKYKEIGNLSQERKTLFKIGLIFWKMEDYQSAIDKFKESWRIERENPGISVEELIEQYVELSLIVEPVGNILLDSYYTHTKYFLPILERMLYLNSHFDLHMYMNPNNYSDSLRLLGDYYLERKDYHKAIEYYQTALDIDSTNNKKVGEGLDYRVREMILVRLGESYYQLGNLKQALEFFKKSNNPDSVGDFYYAQGNYAKAIQFYKKNAEFNQLRLAATLFSSGKLTEAEQILSKEMNSGQYDGNFFLFNRNEKIFNSSDDVQALMGREQLLTLPKILQEILIAKNKVDAALEVAELSQNRALVKLLASKSSSSISTLSNINNFKINEIKEVAKKQNSTIVKYSIIYDTYGTATYKYGKQKEESELFIWVIKPTGKAAFSRVNLKDLSEKINNSLNPSLLYILGYWTVINIITIGFIILICWLIKSNILAKILNNQRLKKGLSLPLLISIVTCLGIGFFVAIQQQPVLQNRGVQKILENQDTTALGKLIYALNPSNTSENRGLTEILTAETCNNCFKELHKLLITPIADLLPSNPEERIIFITESELSYVPFAALQDSKGKYLIEKHTILTSPSIQALEFTHQRRQELESSDKKLSRVKNPVVVGNPKMPKFFYAPGKPPKPLNSLRYAKQEANNIAQMLNSQAITGNQATESYIRQLLPKAQIIHLATHGLSNNFPSPYNGNYSFGYPGAIALTPSVSWEEFLTLEENISNAKKDGFLTSGEIVDLKLNAELVVLSACESGRGRDTSEGILGLSRSFIAAGVPSVVVSLWAVNDKSTSDLMTKFYENLQQHPDKAQALRQAMLTTMKKYPSPKYWAAFTLIGEAE